MRIPAIVGALSLVASTALAQGELTGEQVYRVDAPPPGLVLVLNFAGTGGAWDTTAILDAFDAALRDRASLRRVRLADDFGARCVADPTSPDVCLVRAVTPTFDPLLPNVATRRMSRLERDLASAEPEALPSVTLTLTLAAGEAGARLRVRAFSVPEAVRRLVEAQQAAGAPVSAPELEALMERSLLVTAKRDGVSATDPETYRDLLTADLAPLIDPHPRWGELVFDGLPEGATIALTPEGAAGAAVDRPAGALRTRFTDVPPGRYRVTAAAPGHADGAWDLEMTRANQSRTLRLEPETGVARWGVGLAGGLSVVAAGGLTGLAVSRAGGSGITCANADCPSAPGATFDPVVTEGGSDPNPGFPVAPVAAGLGVAGAAWIVGALVEGEKDELPWWSIAIGVVAGAAAFGVGYALTGNSTALDDLSP